jgi:hypothetical protein
MSYRELGNELVTAGPGDAESGFIAEWIAEIPVLRWTIQIEYGIDKRDVLYITKNNDTSNMNWWAEGGWRKLLRASDEIIFNPAFAEENYEASMRLLPAMLISGDNGAEALAIGIDHCVFGPLKKFYEEKLAVSTSKSQISRLETNIKKCIKLAETYKNGIPYEDLSRELVPMETTLEIIRVDGRDTMILNKCARWRFRFLHTRWNHVDVMLADSNPERIGVVEMRSVIKQLMELKKPFVFEGDMTVPRAIETAEKKYRCSFPYDDLFEKFNEDIGRKYFRVDYCTERGLWDYITCAIRQNSHIKFQDIPKGIKGLKEVDCIRGYTQFKANPWYRGFLGCVWDWCGEIPLDVMRKFLGIYTIRVLTVTPYIQYVGGLTPGCIVAFTSPMIEMMVDKGWITCEVLYGIYGSRADFEFPPEFQQKYDDKTGVLGTVGIPLYTLWSGMTSAISQNRVLRHHTGLQLCRDLRDKGENISWVYADECYDIEMVRGNRVRRLKPGVTEMADPPGYGVQMIDTETKNNTPQLYAFISNYMRMNMLLEMEKFADNLSDLYACKLDSIVYRGDYTFSGLMRVKEGEIKTDYSMSRTMFNKCMFNRCEFFDDEEFPPISSCLFAGAGGSGKSHRASKMRRLLYSAPMWSANVDFKNKFGCKMVMPYQSVLGVGCEGLLDKVGGWLPATIFWDEATMLPQSHQVLALKVSPHIRQIYGGDFDIRGRPFQTVLSVSADECLSVNNMPRVEFTLDYRSVAGDKLIEVKQAIRKIMFEHYGDVKMLLDYVRSVIRGVDRAFVMENYTVADWILAGTHTNCNEWTMLLWEKGFRKWRVGDKGNRAEVSKALRGEEAHINGDIVLKEITGRTNPAHCFTIHSVQGKTVESKIFIDMRSLGFNYCLLYTAVSRARRLGQLYLVF